MPHGLLSYLVRRGEETHILGLQSCPQDSVAIRVGVLHIPVRMKEDRCRLFPAADVSDRACPHNAYRIRSYNEIFRSS